MKQRVREAALKILLLQQQFTPEELLGAVRQVGGNEGEDLFAYLARTATSPRSSSGNSSEGSGPRKGESQALRELKQTNPEKFAVLKEFETLIREGQVLATMDAFRAFGKALDKEFSPGKSRKDAVGRLMRVLAAMDIDSIRTAISDLPSEGDEGTNTYRRLANQIMSGQTNHKASGLPPQ